MKHKLSFGLIATIQLDIRTFFNFIFWDLGGWKITPESDLNPLNL